MSYFSPYGYSKNKIEVELYLPDYATESDLKKRSRCRYITIYYKR